MKAVNLFDQINLNKRNSVLLSFLVIAVLMSLVYVIMQIFTSGFSIGILTISGLLIILYTYFTYQYGDKIVIAATGARLVQDERKYAHLVNSVEGLSIAAGIPKPKIYVMESDDINAFATGKDPKNASIAVTRGAIEKLNRQELEGVIGHEISHVRNFDIRFATVVGVMVGLVAIISDMFLRSMWYGGDRRDRGKEGGILILIGLVLAVLAPIVVRLVQLAISRKREYLADASSAQLTRYPDGLADALEKIKKNHNKMKISDAVSHLFFDDPTKTHLDSLFATHPSIDSRIKLLRSM